MIKAAVLTVLIETILFFLYGYRQKTFLCVVALANLLTNVTLNLSVFLSALLISRQILPGFVLSIVIAAGEAAAVAVEYIIYETYLKNRNTSPVIVAAGAAGAAGDAGAAGAAGAAGDEANAAGIVGGRRTSRQKRRLFLQVLLSNAVSFGTGLLLTHFTS